MITADIFKRILKGRVVIVGIGNVLRGDDGLGPELVQRLSYKVEACCINAGNALENHLGPIGRYNPDTVLLVDAMHLGLRPGDVRIVDPSRIEHAGLSTHDVSPCLFLDFLVEASNCNVFLLGVQPEGIEIGSGMSTAVQNTLDSLERELLEALGGVARQSLPEAARPRAAGDFEETITIKEENGSWKQHGTFSPL